MAAIFHTLQDPHIVRRFQTLCGIRAPGRVEKEARPSERSRHPEQNGKSHNEATKNGTGDIPNGLTPNNNIRTRKIITNGIAIGNGNSIPTENGYQSTTKSKPTENGFATPQTSENKTESDDAEYVIEGGFVPKLLFYLFSFGAGLGNELFYITFYPFWFWNCDAYVGRRICVFWCLFMYLGQATKDIVKLPRPASPPVIRMEQRYALEYGLPSTHTMVGAGFPFGILLLTYGRYEYPLMAGLLIACFWCLLVGLSRMYLGMHSILDVLSGFAYILLLIPLVFPFLDSVDHFVLTSPYSPYVCVLVPLALCLCYPTLDKWSTARGDTTVIMAVGAGLAVGSWICCQYQLMEYAVVAPPYKITMPDGAMLSMMAARLVVGVLLLVATRAVMKTISFSLVCKLAGIDRHDKKATQRLIIELPYKFVTYLMIAVNSCVLCPWAFTLLGIQRESFYYEL